MIVLIIIAAVALIIVGLIVWVGVGAKRAMNRNDH